ncbi:MAG: hypothetical protein KBD53_10680 [Candidatus Omnitrophica bacterium]|nr:hypothetical protein [Candidatus Omnitrophota bacterium]
MKIYFLSTKKNRHPIDQYLALWGRIQARNILPVTYESFIKKKFFPAGLYIYSDIELLQGSLREEVIRIHQKLSGENKHYRFLNNPSVTLSRYPLLKNLYDIGLNSFNVYPLNENYSNARFPVFLRKANDHRGPQTQLLNSVMETEETLAELRHKNENLEDWMVTEYCHVAGQDGIFRKYAAFIVGETIIPRHVLFGTDWVQKYPKNMQELFLSEEIDFFLLNPYENELRRIFKAAGIQYGRIDFGILDGKIETWEINTNPMIISHSSLTGNGHKNIHKLFFDKFSSVLNTFITTSGPRSSSISYVPDRAVSLFYRLSQRYRMTKIGHFIQRLIWRIEKIIK